MGSSAFLSVGIDVGSSFSRAAIVNPQGQMRSKPFKIKHESKDSMEAAVSRIKKEANTASMKVSVFIEPSGIFYIPLFCYLHEKKLDVHVLDPLVDQLDGNDKSHAASIAKCGLMSSAKTIKLPDSFVKEFGSLVGSYYINYNDRIRIFSRLVEDLNLAFPQYLHVFPGGIKGNTALMILEKYGTPEKILHAKKATLLKRIAETSDQDSETIENWYNKLIKAATEALQFRCNIDVFYDTLIPSDVKFIQLLNKQREIYRKMPRPLIEKGLKDFGPWQEELLKKEPDVFPF